MTSSTTSSSLTSSLSASSSSSPVAVDESLYSRQLYVMGVEAQQRLSSTSVLLLGINGVGIEVAKNLCLCGIKHLTICDSTIVTLRDLENNFYLRENHIGKSSRQDAVLSALQELNPYVKVEISNEIKSAEDLKEQTVRKYHVVVMCDGSLSTLTRVNSLCHSLKISFVFGQSFGVFSTVFVDAHDHIIMDHNGETLRRGMIYDISKSNPGIVTLQDEARHGLEDGDLVTFEDISGMTELNHSPPRPIKVISHFAFSIEDTSFPSHSPYRHHETRGGGGYFQQVKKTYHVTFQPLSEQLSKPSLLSEWNTEGNIHAAFIAIKSLSSPIRPNDPKDAQEALKVLKSFKFPNGDSLSTTATDDFFLSLFRCSSCEISPMCSIVGGVTAQEVLKCLTGKFTPIKQFWHFDSSRILPSFASTVTPFSSVDFSVFSPKGDRYDSQRGIFGDSLHNSIRNLNYFVVGAGAIGCELLKIFSLMGVGRVTITDMDNIEKTNLSRQFLFRQSDVGQLKSLTAAREAMKINSDCKISSSSLRVGSETEEIFHDDFWSSLSGVATALDNVDARLYVDAKCLFYQKSMVDSGTLGTKGSSQVIVPHLTESYGSSRDPPEETFPICLLKLFPNKIEHTIQWARDQFEGYFKLQPHEGNRYMEGEQGKTEGKGNENSYLEELSKKPSEYLPTLQMLNEMFITHRVNTFIEAIQWGRNQFEMEFSHKIKELIAVFPHDAKTAEGHPFWSGAKRCPIPLEFDVDDNYHLMFVVTAACLKSEVCNIPLPKQGDINSIAREVLKDYSPPPMKIEKKKIATTDAEVQQMKEKEEAGEGNDDEYSRKVHTLRSSLPSSSSSSSSSPSSPSLPPSPFTKIEFEKDFDSHVQFLTSCSNLRARNYHIKEVGLMETKLIGGKIIPAISTTTALVSGFAWLEILQLAQQKKLITDFRVQSCNLALPFFAEADPIECKFTTTKLSNGDFKWSIWDQLTVDGLASQMTLKEFLDSFKKKYGMDISIVSRGEAMLYFAFGMQKKKVAERMAMTMTTLAETVGKTKLKETAKFLQLEITCSDSEGNDIELPQIVIRIK